MTKRALLVGSSFSAAPIFFELKKRGLHVSVCGNDRADPCHQYADQSYYFDYSIREDLLALVQKEAFDYLVPSCNDFSYMSCAWVAQQCGFPGYDSYENSVILYNKNSFREFTSSSRLAAPKTIQIKAGDQVDTEGLQFPLLVKPVDSFSGRGVTKVANEVELLVAIDAAIGSSRSGDMVVEEFVSGGLHSHSAFIRDHKIAVDFFVDEYCTVYPYQVNCSNHPSKLSEFVKNSIRVEMVKLVELLQINDGLLHTQVIVNGNDFWIIECMRRGPGDLYGNLVSMSTGANYTDLLVRPFIGEKLPASVDVDNIKYVGRHTISTAEPLVNFTFSHSISTKDFRVVPLKSSGEHLGVAPYDKLAIVFAEFYSQEDMLKVSPQFESLVSIQSLGRDIRGE